MYSRWSIFDVLKMEFCILLTNTLSPTYVKLPPSLKLLFVSHKMLPETVITKAWSWIVMYHVMLN